MEGNETTKMIVFRLGEEYYGIPVSLVGSIERLQKITRIPKVPSFIKGVINLRGVVTPVMDLKVRFGMPAEAFNEQTRMVIVQYADKEVGMIVDAANDVVDITETQIESPPDVVGSIDKHFVKGVVNLKERLLIILDVEELLEVTAEEITS